MPNGPLTARDLAAALADAVLDAAGVDLGQTERTVVAVLDTLLEHDVWFCRLSEVDGITVETPVPTGPIDAKLPFL